MNAEILKKLDKIKLIEKKPHNPVEELQDMFPNKKLFVCDFYVKESEQGIKQPFGLEFKNVTNIDHHAPIPEMSGHISSGILASRYVQKNGPISKGIILINHCDCDSIISSFLMAGIIQPDKKFDNAVIAADHTGVDNEIADLLQSIQYNRNVLFITKNLFLFLEGKEIEPEAQKLVKKKQEEKKLIQSMITGGKVKTVGDVVVIVTKEEIDPTFAIKSMPEAKVIIAAYPRTDNNKWNVRVRLGQAAEDIELNTMEIPDFGGRWNAGSTRRTGGTDIPPEEYAQIINEKISKK